LAKAAAAKHRTVTVDLTSDHQLFIFCFTVLYKVVEACDGQKKTMNSRAGKIRSPVPNFEMGPSVIPQKS
jgi:hypothetical protein